MPPVDPFRHHSVKSFYHFTDLQNLDSIRKHGGLFSLAELRRRKIIVAKPGGNQWSHDADSRLQLDRFVHLCLRESHPMEYCARQGGHIGDTRFLEIDPSVRHLEGVMYSPDVSNKAGVSVVPIAAADGKIDGEVLYTKTDWTNPEIKARLKLASKCELLVPNFIPAEFIRNL